MSTQVCAYSQAPPAGRSSLATPVTVAYAKPIAATDPATRRGSSVSSGPGRPVAIWQKSQRLVHWPPPIRKVASRSSQHSKMLGQAASSQTVCRPSRLTSCLSSVYCGPVRSRVLIHGGLRSIGVWLLRASIRSSLRSPGASTTCLGYVGAAGHRAVALAGRGFGPVWLVELDRGEHPAGRAPPAQVDRGAVQPGQDPAGAGDQEHVPGAHRDEQTSSRGHADGYAAEDDAGVDSEDPPG